MPHWNRTRDFGETCDREDIALGTARENKGVRTGARTKSWEEMPKMGLRTTGCAVELEGVRGIQLRLPGI